MAMEATIPNRKLNTLSDGLPEINYKSRRYTSTTLFALNVKGVSISCRAWYLQNKLTSECLPMSCLSSYHILGLCRYPVCSKRY